MASNKADVNVGSVHTLFGRTYLGHYSDAGPPKTDYKGRPTEIAEVMSSPLPRRMNRCWPPGHPGKTEMRKEESHDNRPEPISQGTEPSTHTPE